MKIIPWRNKGHERRTHDRPLARMHDGFGDLMQRLWQDPWGVSLSDFFGASEGFGPRLDMSETENEYSLRFELPGIRSEDVDIRVSGNVLTLSGEKKHEHESRRGGATYSECSFGSFSRSVTLPTTVDADKVDASYKDGVLTVTLAKHPDAKPRKITVRNA
jgi:HSP20 family protein